MLSRRQLIFACVAFGIAPGRDALAHHTTKRKKFTINPRFRPQDVPFSGYPPGVINVDTHHHFLYLTLSNETARRYGIGVGRAGLAFKGETRVGREAKWPSWRPTKNMIRRNPRKYARYARGVPGGPNNPLGARAIYLYRGNRDTMYRIHGTNVPRSIGRSVSNGCIRLNNSHVVDLYSRVPIDTKVVVL